MQTNPKEKVKFINKGSFTFNHFLLLGHPWWLSSKESTCNAGHAVLIPGLRRSAGEENGYPLQYACLENPYGQRSLVGYSPWASTESGMTQ